MKGRGSKEKRWFRWNPSRHARIPEGDLGRMQTPSIGEGRRLVGDRSGFRLHHESRSLHSENMKTTTLAMSVFNNIKNLNFDDLRSSLPLVLNHIPKRDYGSMDELIDLISDQVDWSIEDYIDEDLPLEDKPAAKDLMDFWKEVYEISTLHFNGVTIG